MSTVTSPIILDSTGQAIADAIASLSSPQASAYTSNPAALGASASPGSSTNWARGDHVHPKPSVSDLGAAAADLGISSASVGQVVIVSAVDANNKPTAFSTATLLSAAGVSF